MLKTRSLLLIEDSDADSEATVRALNKCSAPPTIHRCRDGDEALAFLRGRTGEAEAPIPTVILLDLNLPGMDGREVLEQIKTDEAFRHIPVVILTTSGDRSDVAYCYRKGASGYMTKPLDLGQFSQTIRDFCAYWFDTVVLPDFTDRR